MSQSVAECDDKFWWLEAKAKTRGRYYREPVTSMGALDADRVHVIGILTSLRGCTAQPISVLTIFTLSIFTQLLVDGGD